MDHAAAMKRARTEGELVWHYTTLDTLTLILQGNSLLATEVSFQNDIRETSTADAAFREALGSMTDDETYGLFAGHARRYLEGEGAWASSLGLPSRELEHDARFILCASNDPDSLYAWRTYSGGGIGCAIGLDPKVPLGIVDPDDNHSPRRIRHWRHVIYQPSKVREAAKQALRKLGDRWNEAHVYDVAEEGSNEAFGLLVAHLTEARADVRSRAKDPSFSDEHEQRVTVESFSRQALLTTPSSMGPRPHVRLVTSPDNKWGTAVKDAAASPKLPIRAVRLGPDAPQSATAATQWLLLANEYEIDPGYVDDGAPPPWMRQTWGETVVLDRSAHPYRSR
jgi:hypothetical protein